MKTKLNDVDMFDLELVAGIRITHLLILMKILSYNDRGLGSREEVTSLGTPM